MSDFPILTFDPVFLAYIGVFAAALLACFLSVLGVRSVADRDTRRGLGGLLVTSGVWAGAHLGFLLAPTTELKTGFYIAGLVVGLSTVGPWLYFCSAYTGRTLHRNRPLQHTAVAIFAGIVAIKVTNPIHGLYLTTTEVSTPFTYLAVQTGLLHWVFMGLAYALAFVGYFMLLEFLLQVDYDVRPFLALLSLTALPVLFDIVGLLTPSVLKITHQPLGVAIFAIGVVYVYRNEFESIRIAGDREHPVIVVNAANEIRNYNDAASATFPSLTAENVRGTALESVLPDLAKSFRAEDAIFEYQPPDGEESFYYQLTHDSFRGGGDFTGAVLILNDVTERERARTEIEIQNERLDTFASMVSHDLRNPLNVAQGRVEIAREERDSEHLKTTENALERMETLIEDILTLAREGRKIDELERVSLATVAQDCWSVVESADASLVVQDDLAFEADPDRLQQVFENLFRNAIEHGGPDVRIEVGSLAADPGFYVADDGPGIPAELRETIFESGVTSSEQGTGFGLAIVAEIVAAHGWEIDLAPTETGARFEIRGVETDAS